MRHGIVILPQDDWPGAGRRWRLAEEYGFDHAWTYDHLSWRSLAGERWHAAVPTLTAAAMITDRIGLGLFVASPNFRHPVPFAKEVATLDDISGGRVFLGVGSGGTGFDAFVLGQTELTPAERHRRFLEFVEGLDALLRFEQADAGISFAGEWFTAHEARMVGAPARGPRMPLLLAANGPRAIRYAAQHGDGWVTTGGNEDDDVEAWWAGVAERVRRFDDALEAAGRAGIPRFLSLDDENRYSLTSAAAYEDAVGRAEELGFTDVVAHWPRADGIYAGEEAVLERVVGLL